MFRLQGAARASTSKSSPRTVTTEHGKTLDEARGSVRRGIECVEVACGAPSLLHGRTASRTSRPGIDCHVVRQPLGVCAAIAPFNFPAMVPLWFLPFAHRDAATPSSSSRPSRCRCRSARSSSCWPSAICPPGVVNLVNGGTRRRRTRSAITPASAPSRSSDRPPSRGTSTSAATHAGKRVQALGGAKNFVVVMPDADLDRADADHHGVVLRLRRASAAWRAACCCRSGSMHADARERMVEAARALRVGDGADRA